MSISRKLKNASSGAADGGGGSAGGYVDDVFSTYVYEGTGGMQNIETGIDLDGEGGLVWTKSRTTADPNQLTDTESGYRLMSDKSDAGEANQNNVTFSSNGHTAAGSWFNNSSKEFVSWTFRKAPNFFDVVTYTGTGASGYQIPHNLGCRPGMIIAKKLDDTGSWWTWHGGLPNNDENFAQALKLDESSAAGSFKAFMLNEEQTDKVFTLSGVSNRANDAGAEYVAYLFAHNDGDGGFGETGDQDIIKCGSYDGNGLNDGPTINLGFEPQWILQKRIDVGEDWHIFDNMRGVATGGSDFYLRPNGSDDENSNTWLDFTSTGFKITSSQSNVNHEDGTYIYMAIRRPNKPAEEFEPEELFAVNTRGTVPNEGAGYRSGFVTDFAFRSSLSGGSIWPAASSRLTGDAFITMSGSAAESPSNVYRWDFMDGYYVPSSANTDTPSWMFRRAPGFFDVVAYTGDGTAGRTVNHNLGVTPEMMWVKGRDAGGDWFVYNEPAGGVTKYFLLNQNYNVQNSSPPVWNNTAPTETDLTVGSELNAASANYIAYLFASVPGISKVGSYTGNGALVGVDCGFTNGARFVLIKRTDAAGDWMVFDTLRGIANDNSPMLKLNEADAQATGPYIRSWPEGFRAGTSGLETLASIDGAEYIFYAIA